MKTYKMRLQNKPIHKISSKSDNGKGFKNEEKVMGSGDDFGESEID